MTTVLSLLLILYLLMLVALLTGWVRIRRQQMPPRTANPPGVSVVIAFRNEAANLAHVVADLVNSSFPPDRFEIILVDDHSEDNSREVIQTTDHAKATVTVLQLPLGKQGKKAALTLAIEHARFGIVATTDADCRLSKNWISCVASYFEDEQTKMLLGPVKLSGDGTFFGNLQILEFVSVAATTAATIGLGHPVMANGANFAFRKDVFKEVGGYEDNMAIASGDDEFLLRRVCRRYPDGVRYLNYFEATVSTPPQPGLKSFFHQRMRWAGKWRHNSDALARGMAAFVLFVQTAFLILLFRNILHPGASLTLVVMKVFFEGILLAWMSSFLDRRFNGWTFLLMQLFYPPYVIGVSIGSMVFPYHWKGRRYGNG